MCGKGAILHLTILLAEVWEFVAGQAQITSED